MRKTILILSVGIILGLFSACSSKKEKTLTLSDFCGKTPVTATLEGKASLKFQGDYDYFLGFRTSYGSIETIKVSRQEYLYYSGKKDINDEPSGFKPIECNK